MEKYFNASLKESEKGQGKTKMPAIEIKNGKMINAEGREIKVTKAKTENPVKTVIMAILVVLIAGYAGYMVHDLINRKAISSYCEEY